MGLGSIRHRGHVAFVMGLARTDATQMNSASTVSIAATTVLGRKKTIARHATATLVGTQPRGSAVDVYATKATQAVKTHVYPGKLSKTAFMRTLVGAMCVTTGLTGWTLLVSDVTHRKHRRSPASLSVNLLTTSGS